MPACYQVTEPHPSVPNSRYLQTGRGGTGNFSLVLPWKITPPTTATGPASRTTLKPSPTRRHSGRGGAGNLQPYYRDAERAIFSFDEELRRDSELLERQAPIFHVGRGGAGNAIARPGSARAMAMALATADLACCTPESELELEGKSWHKPAMSVASDRSSVSSSGGSGGGNEAGSIHRKTWNIVGKAFGQQ